MRCERVQELILTDYMDRELDAKGASEVDAHIRSCPACREFKRAAEETASAPFRGIRGAEAPSYIWERVRQKIALHETERPGVIVRAADSLKGLFLLLGRIPKPAVAFAAAAAVIIAVLVARPIVQTRAANEYLAEQIDFIIQLDAGETNGNGNFFNLTDV